MYMYMTVLNDHTYHNNNINSDLVMYVMVLPWPPMTRTYERELDE